MMVHGFAPPPTRWASSRFPCHTTGNALNNLTRFWASSIAILLLGICASMQATEPPPEKLQYNRDIRPILSHACFICHGPDADARQAELRLDVRADAVRETESGALPIVPGKATVSELIQRISTADLSQRMPPKGHTALTAEQIETLTHWINQGAEYQQHWAFITPTKVEIPTVKNQSWTRNSIDKFVLARLEKSNLVPNAQADREALIRRVSFDLTGLPPTLEEIDTFLADTQDTAYETMVDHFLESSAYGEQMARYWLDLARYADTNGYQYDTERTQWVWRDWVIHAYNSNMPFDQFTIEQLAGDLIPDGTPQQQLATGFNRNHAITIEGGIISEEYRVEYVMDRVVTTGAVWLGMTVGCARCHDHKYDPLSQTEFYQILAYFNQVPEKGNSGFDPRATIASPLAAKQNQTQEAEIETLRAELAKPHDITDDLEKWTRTLHDKDIQWHVLTPDSIKSSGGTTLTLLDDRSVLATETNPAQDTYEITATTILQNITAIRLECLTHESLPGGGPGRYSNSNFVLSEFELRIKSSGTDKEETPWQAIKFASAIAEYNQTNYHVNNAIDGTTAGNNGWAVDGPTRKEPVASIFVAQQAFSEKPNSQLQFRLRHETSFGQHGIGRLRLSATTADPTRIQFESIPAEIITIAKIDAAQRNAAQTKTITEYFLANHDPQKSLQDKLAKLVAVKNNTFPPTMVMRDMSPARKTFVLNRGQYNEPTTEVSVGVPGVFPALPTDSAPNRLGFAQWLMQPDHPLTARVAVNRYWQRLFGVGLVKTLEDFGTQGELPSHPQLLDWLALDFKANGWNIKRTLKTILLSATYRQSAQAPAAAYQQDPDNRQLARGPRMRLSAEEIRDSALAISDLLVHKIGGKSVYPYQPLGIWMELNNRPGYSRKYPQATGEDLYRRSLYTFWKRTVPSPMLKTLDAPEREFCTIQRSRTNTPLQSLLLLNAPQFVEAARHLAGRVMADNITEPNQQIRYIFRLVTGRTPSKREVSVIQSVYRSQLTAFTSDTNAVDELLAVGDSDVDDTLDRPTLAAWTMVCRMLLNLDEAISK
ncbi:MAG TPA: DUF1553 domain-containing protein [Planctomycetes bacterium]|nr:DUF1553 domain-containing protein [Planctomycetaceae bacterium]HIN55321.1 DUF1553 domain-containing protein [Planctomycetota bacterium]